MARAADQSVQSDVLIKVRKPEDGDDAGGTKPKGPDHAGRSHAVRKDQTGHRQNLQVKRLPRLSDIWNKATLEVK